MMSIFQNIFYKLLLTIIFLFIFRLGLYIPSPSIDIDFFINIFKTENSSFKLLNIVSSNLFGSFSLLSLGVMPYVLSSILVQIISYIMEDESGGKKSSSSDKSNFLSKLTRILTAVFAVFQCLLLFINTNLDSVFIDIFEYKFLSYIICFFSVVSGALISLWIGELITECGLGNGISMIIFANVSSELESSLIKIFSTDFNSSFGVILFLLIFVVLVFFIVLCEKSFRLVAIQYSASKYNSIGKKNAFLPMKINFAGVMPLIFANTIIAFVLSISHSFFKNFFLSSTQEKVFYYVLCFIFLFLFSYIYNGIIFNVTKVSDSLKKSGGFISGVRPGIFTAQYFSNILHNLTFIGSFYLFSVLIFIELVKSAFNISQMINGSSFVILVVIALELISKCQVEFTNFYSSRNLSLLS